jgi:hypothetical protein
MLPSGSPAWSCAAGEIARRTTTTTLSEVARRCRHLLEEMTRRGGHGEVLAYCREGLLAGDCFDMTFEATKDSCSASAT